MTHPPAGPSTPPPPPGPKVAAFQTPARQSNRPDRGSPLAGGPVEPSVVVTGKEPTPGSAAAISSAARESTRVVAGAGASSGRGGKGALERAPRPDFPCESCAGTCQSRLDCIGQPVRVGFTLPKPPPFRIGLSWLPALALPSLLLLAAIDHTAWSAWWI